MSTLEKEDVGDVFERKDDHYMTMSELPVEATMDPAGYKKVERRARLKLDILIVPLCLLLYFLSFLDRSNIGQAKLSGKPLGMKNGKMQYADPGEGIASTLKLNSHDYAVALTVLYPTYIAFEIPSNLLIKRVGAGIWIPGLVTMWGIVATLQGLVQSKYGLYINRIFLGLTEAGVLPGIAVYLTFFYKPRELQFRQAIFFTGASLSGAFSGLLATAIRKMDGMQGQEGWRWVFYLEGIFTVLAGVCCFFLLPSTIEKCWVLNPTEKRLMTERLNITRHIFRERPELKDKVETTYSEYYHSKEFDYSELWRQEIKRTFLDPAIWLICVSGFCIALVVYSIAYFAPTVVQEINTYSPVRSMLMSCPPFAVAFVYSVAIAVVSDLFQLRILTALPGQALSLIGYVVMYACKDPMTRYGGLIMATAGAYSVPPALFSWIANNSSGHYKRATGLATLIIFTNSGGLLSSWLFPAEEAKTRYKRGTLVILSLQALGVLVAILIEAYYLYERRMRAIGKRDHRVLKRRGQHNWTDDEIRAYLGDSHPEYQLEL